MGEIKFKVVGYVKSQFKNPKETIFCCEKGLKSENISEIILEKEYQEGLLGIEKFSHIFVIYHLNQIDKMEIKTHPGPPSIQNLPRVGVFASRSQYRPNPIALRLVRLIKVENNIISVEGLDAIDGSQVIDIKPYVSGFDRPENFSMASWYDWMKN